MSASTYLGSVVSNMTKKGREAAYSALEVENLLISQGVSLGDDRNQVDFRVKTAHEFDINLLKAKG